jgi:hypothetical protein
MKNIQTIMYKLKVLAMNLRPVGFSMQAKSARVMISGNFTFERYPGTWR